MSTPRIAAHREPAEPPIDVNAEPWHDASEPPPVAAERTPERGDKISVLDIAPRRLAGEARPSFGYAFALIRRVRFEVKSKRWNEELRTRCRDGHGFPNSKALVTDENGRIRALTEAAGSDDSAGTSSLFYDENERLRCMFISYRHYSGTSTEQLVAFDARGAALGCDYLVLKRGASMWNLCEKPEREDDVKKLDPAVQRALSAETKARAAPPNPFDEFLTLNPRDDFELCLPESYKPFGD